MNTRDRERFARKFGLPADQIRTFEELSLPQRAEVARVYSLHNAGAYVYAVKRNAALVWNRFKRQA